VYNTNVANEELEQEARDFINKYQSASEEDLAYLAGLLESSKGDFDKGHMAVIWPDGRTDTDVWDLMENLQERFGPLVHTSGPDIWWSPLIGEGGNGDGLYQRLLPYFKTQKHLAYIQGDKPRQRKKVRRTDH
jgi:hypothetical protein